MINAFCLEKDIIEFDIKDISRYKNKRIWIDITAITETEKETITNAFNLHPLTAEDLYNSHVRIKIEEFDHYLFYVMYAIRKTKKMDLIEIDLILGKNFLITNHVKPIDSIEAIKREHPRIRKHMSKGPEFLFHRLIDLEIDNYFPALEYIDDSIEDLESEITIHPRPELLKDILNQKRQIIMIKKVALQQREKISFLAKNEYRFISEAAIPYFRDIYDHAIRVSDTIDNFREAIGSSFDAYMSSVSNSMNEVMKVLSMIATIALPLTVISGIYGTNFSTLPGAGFQYGFWIMVVLMTMMCISMIWYFRKKKWF